MEYYLPMSDKEFSRRKLEEYEQLEKIIKIGRKDPIWFIENFFGVQLIDYQKWFFMNSWYKPYVLWLCSRRAGKTTTAACFYMAKLLLIPNYKVYISANSANQSSEVFEMLENIALQRVQTFATATDFFSEEVVKGQGATTGFKSSNNGRMFTLYNNSFCKTLTTNLAAERGKGGSVFFDETAWQTWEQTAVLDKFAATDSSFSTGVGDNTYIRPKQMPYQLLYASSAGDVEFPFYEKYRNFSKKMIMGDDRYFVCDINADTILDFSTINGKKIVPNLTREAVEEAYAEDSDKADREYYNKFRRGAGQNSVVRMECFVRNSERRVPLLKNDTGGKKFILCFDPARNFDGSILSVYQVLKDKKIGYYLRIVNSVSMVDANTKGKTPLPMTEQLKIIKDLLIRYNGVGVPEWQNIELYIDAGAGGGGISAVADQLMENWADSTGKMHRGMIDPEHKQYETARLRYRNAAKNIHLINPQSHKKIMYDALERVSSEDLIKYTEYDGKEYLSIPDPENAGEYIQYQLSYEERLALTNIELLKTETSYMCRYDNPNGSVQYELAREKRGIMHDDRAYTNAMAAYALAQMRRTELINANEDANNVDYLKKFARASRIYH